MSLSRKQKPADTLIACIYPCRPKRLDAINIHRDDDKTIIVELAYTDGAYDIHTIRL